MRMGGGFHKISSPNQQAENDGHSSGWAGALLPETNPDILLLHLRGAIKRPHQWICLKYEAPPKKSWSELKLYMIWESRSLPFSTQASAVGKWCFIEWGDWSFNGLLSPQTSLRSCLFPMLFINYSIIITVLQFFRKILTSALNPSLYTPVVNMHKPGVRAAPLYLRSNGDWVPCSGAPQATNQWHLSGYKANSFPWVAWMSWIMIFWSPLLRVTKEISHSFLRMKMYCQDYSS